MASEGAAHRADEVPLGLKDGRLLGFCHGFGVQIGPDGGHYEGDFKDDKIHGRGIRTGTNGIMYLAPGETLAILMQDISRTVDEFSDPDGRRSLYTSRLHQRLSVANVRGTAAIFHSWFNICVTGAAP